jgi:glycosyltransferase involved in cell wall biosynthesis
MSQPRLTVITPSLNQGRFIERAIRSVLDQGHPELEYIVVDGGSTDETLDVLRRYEGTVTWTSEPDRGQTDALNKGLARATGDVVAYLNSDDYFLPGACAAALPYFEDAGTSWVAGTCRFLHDDGTVEAIWTPSLPIGSRLDWILALWSVPQPSSFWRRSVFDRVGVFRQDLHYAFDTEFMLRLALAGILPQVAEGELAVRYLHDAAKSHDRAPFEQEARQIQRELIRTLAPRDRVDYGLRRARSRFGRWLWAVRGRPA